MFAILCFTWLYTIVIFVCRFLTGIERQDPPTYTGLIWETHTITPNSYKKNITDLKPKHG